MVSFNVADIVIVLPMGNSVITATVQIVQTTLNMKRNVLVPSNPV